MSVHDVFEILITVSGLHLQGWLSRLLNDKKLVVKVAAQTQKAADYIQGLTTPDPPCCRLALIALSEYVRSFRSRNT